MKEFENWLISDEAPDNMVAVFDSYWVLFSFSFYFWALPSLYSFLS